MILAMKKVCLIELASASVSHSNNISTTTARLTTSILQAAITPTVARQDKHPVRLFRAQMHEELSAAKQKFCATVMAQRATPA